MTNGTSKLTYGATILALVTACSRPVIVSSQNETSLPINPIATPTVQPRETSTYTITTSTSTPLPRPTTTQIPTAEPTTTPTVALEKLGPLDKEGFSWSSGIIEGHDGNVDISVEFFMDRTLSEKRRTNKVTHLEEQEDEEFRNVVNGVKVANAFAAAIGTLPKTSNGQPQVPINMLYVDTDENHGRGWKPVNLNFYRGQNTYQTFDPDKTVMVILEQEKFYPGNLDPDPSDTIQAVAAIGIGVRTDTGALILRLGIPATLKDGDYIDRQIINALLAMTDLHYQQLSSGNFAFPNREKLMRIGIYWNLDTNWEENPNAPEIGRLILTPLIKLEGESHN